MGFINSIWTPSGLHIDSMDSNWTLETPYSLFGVHKKSRYSPVGVHVDFLKDKMEVIWSLCGVYVESMWTLNGMWLSVKYRNTGGLYNTVTSMAL